MLFLRGLRWRRGFTLAVLVVGTIGAAVATIGPVYARAAAESTLTDELRAGGWRAGLAFSATGSLEDSGGPAGLARRLGTTVDVPGYGRPIRGEATRIIARGAGSAASTPTTLVWREDQCAHLVLTAGRCPAATGEAIVPAAAAAETPHWQLGETLSVYQQFQDQFGFVDGPAVRPVRIVGTYRPRDDTEDYWFGASYFSAGRSASGGVGGIALVDAIFATPGSFVPATGLPPPEVRVGLDVPLRPSAIRLDDVAALRAHVAALGRRVPPEARGLGRPSLRTSLTSVLADADRDHRQVDQATLVVVLELAALSLLVLFRVVAGAVAARGDEIALAKLRGLPPARTVAFALREPLSLLLVAAPLGFGVGVGVTHLLARRALVAGTPVALTPAAGWALGAALAGGALAAALASVTTLTRPVLAQWRATSPPRVGRRWWVLFDLAVAALAIAAVITVRRSAHPRAVFLVAPALVVLAVALLGVRLLPRLAGLGLAPTRGGRHLAAFLALRQTVRRPSGLRLAVLLAVAAGLATFAVCGEAVARANRTARADTELGSAQQVSVQFEQAHDPQVAVRRADPGGDWAMAAASWLADGGPPGGGTVVGPLLGLDAPRLAAVGFAVRGQLSPTAIARDVTDPGTVGAVTVTGSTVRVDLAVTALTGDRPTLDVRVRRPGEGPVTASAGLLRLGRHTYVAQVDCASGCTLAGLEFDRSIDAQPSSSGAATLYSIATDRGRVAARLTAGAWRSDAIGYGASVSARGVGDALGLTFRSTGGGSPVLAYADTPARLPIVAAPAATVNSRTSGGVQDFSTTEYAYRVVRTASPLPVVLQTGAIADLTYLRVRLPDFDREATWTVWLGPDAPADALSRLRHAGLLIQHTTTAQQRIDVLARQGPALGLLLLLVCAIAAAVLAVGGTAVSLLADARRRLFELAALRMVGVPDRVLRRSATVEQALLLGAALLLGVPAGYLAAALVLADVPEFADPTPVVLRYRPPVLAALLCAAALAVLLGLTALVAGRALARAAAASRLREAMR